MISKATDADPEMDCRISLLREAKARKLRECGHERLGSRELDDALGRARADAASPPPGGFVGAGGRKSPIEKLCPECGKQCNRANGRCYACVPAAGPRKKRSPPAPNPAVLLDRNPPAAPTGSETCLAPAITPGARLAFDPDSDPEFEAIKSIHAALGGLDTPARLRVWNYTADRLGLTGGQR